MGYYRRMAGLCQRETLLLACGSFPSRRALADSNSSLLTLTVYIPFSQSCRGAPSLARSSTLGLYSIGYSSMVLVWARSSHTRMFMFGPEHGVGSIGHMRLNVYGCITFSSSYAWAALSSLTGWFSSRYTTRGSTGVMIREGATHTTTGAL
jgi:hypothetical protein